MEISMWPILSLSLLLALASGTTRVYAEQRPARPYSAPWIARQLAQAAPPATIDQRSLGEARPEAMRQCLQQALFWLGRYQGPVGGRASPAYIEALQTYASERDLELMRLEHRRPFYAASSMRWPCLERSRNGRLAVRELSR